MPLANFSKLLSTNFSSLPKIAHNHFRSPKKQFNICISTVLEKFIIKDPIKCRKKVFCPVLIDQFWSNLASTVQLFIEFTTNLNLIIDEKMARIQVAWNTIKETYRCCLVLSFVRSLRVKQLRWHLYRWQKGSQPGP